MKYLPVAPLLPLALVLGACSTSGMIAAPTETAQKATVSAASELARETLLLVSRTDGSVVMQTIESSADLCFKKSSDSATTCLTQGDPVVDPVTNAIVGFEMIENHIELIAKSD